jgi:glycosyltransferase involved in cell wall biosynthesis
VIDQSYENYKLLIIDNGSTDGSYEIAKVILSDLKDKLKSEN